MSVLFVINLEDCFFKNKIVIKNNEIETKPNLVSLYLFKEMIDMFDSKVLLSNNPCGFFEDHRSIKNWFKKYNVYVDIHKELFLVSSPMHQNLFTEAYQIVKRKKEKILFLESFLSMVNELDKEEKALFENYKFRTSHLLGDKRRSSLINEYDYYSYENKELHFEKIINRKVDIKKNETITEDIVNQILDKLTD